MLAAIGSRHCSDGQSRTYSTKPAALHIYSLSNPFYFQNRRPKDEKRPPQITHVNRCRPLFALIQSINPQELPPGCGPPSPGLKGIFGHEMDESELQRAVDGPEHLAASTASKRLTALSSATPKELASHVQVCVCGKISACFMLTCFLSNY